MFKYKFALQISLAAFVSLFLSNILYGKTIPVPNGNGWTAEIRYAAKEEVKVYSMPSEDSQLMGHYNYLERILIVNETGGEAKFGWKKALYPIKGFVQSKNLLSETQKKNIPERIKSKSFQEFTGNIEWEPEILYGSKEFLFVKKEASFSSENIGIIKFGEKILTLIKKSGTQNKVWKKVLYPVDGYVYSTDVTESLSSPLLAIGISYGAVNIPYEKNMENYRNPRGGFIEYSRTNWIVSLRLGYNNSQAHLKKYIMKTQTAYLHIQLTLFKLFDKHLRFYAFGGGGYWFSTFQNTTYPSLEDYFKEEKDKGPSYSFGGGIEYTLRGFFLGVQYGFWGTNLGVFGEEPQTGEFGMQYKVYPAFHQVEIDFGYRFEL
ncbi:MAG: hypothetical protein GXO87_12195 [Chlorobi bacterium]|nr:hypothetical protein [Chlorobiota bacterium]